MSRAEKLQERLGRSMNESLGVRLVTTPSQEVAGKILPSVSPEDGRTRDRLAGHMEVERIIADPDQPRKTFPEESIAQLARSLKSAGQLQPIRVRWSEAHEKWVIISGERRYRAAIQAGMKTVSCVFIDRDLTESEIRQESLIENLLREDLRPIEAAEGYRQLIDMNDWTIQQVAEALNITKGTISKALSLPKLPEDIQAQVDEGMISASSAYEVSRLPSEGEQRELATRIVTEGLKRDDAGVAVGKTARPKERTMSSTNPPPARTTTKVLSVEGVSLTMVWKQKTVTKEDIIRILEKALIQVHASEVA